MMDLLAQSAAILLLIGALMLRWLLRPTLTNGFGGMRWLLDGILVAVAGGLLVEMFEVTGLLSAATAFSVDRLLWRWPLTCGVWACLGWFLWGPRARFAVPPDARKGG